MISNGFRHCDILRSHSFDSITFIQHHAVQFGKTLKRKMLVFVHRDLWAAWELERPHPLFVETSCCPLSGSDWSSEYAWSWHSECKNTSFWCHQYWQDWGSSRWTKGEMHFFSNHYLGNVSYIIYVSLYVSPPSKCWTELIFACSSCGIIAVRDTVSWDFPQHPSATHTKED